MSSDREKYGKALVKQLRERDIATKTPVPYRITQALDLRMLYGPEVDRALGGEEPMVDEWEEGKRVPTPEQVKLLADLTGFPVDFFYWPVIMPGGYGFLCQRSGEGKGCQRVWFGPPAPEAEVIPFPAAPPAVPATPTAAEQATLW